MKDRIVLAAATGMLASPVALVPPVAPAAAAEAIPNAVITWDLKAQDAIWGVARQQPPAQVRSFAMVSGAVYDAVNAVAGSPYQPYLLAPRSGRTESTDAAVATAATQVLAVLFPDQQERLRTEYDEYLAAIPEGPAKQGGIAVGAQAATAMVTARQGDDAAIEGPDWVVGTEPGQWRPTPPTNASDAAWFQRLRPFLVPSAAMFPTPGPPALTSRAYARDVNEVKLVGSASSTARTADQTEAAIWWHDRNSTTWQIKRQVATTQRLSAMQTARLFAMIDLTAIDTAIACFHAKAAWSFWRPITAIRLADTDGNAWTTADPEWTPLLVTPPFPEYPSGHACSTSTRTSVYQYFFGQDDISFSASSVDTGTTRYFSSFSQALTELLNARVWGGVHFRTADEHGAKLGQAITRYVTRHHFRPRR